VRSARSIRFHRVHPVARRLEPQEAGGVEQRVADAGADAPGERQTEVVEAAVDPAMAARHAEHPAHPRPHRARQELVGGLAAGVERPGDIDARRELDVAQPSGVELHVVQLEIAGDRPAGLEPPGDLVHADDPRAQAEPREEQQAGDEGEVGLAAGAVEDGQRAGAGRAAQRERDLLAETLHLQRLLALAPAEGRHPFRRTDALGRGQHLALRGERGDAGRRLAVARDAHGAAVRP
jgi:hypothetical protein